MFIKGFLKTKQCVEILLVESHIRLNIRTYNHYPLESSISRFLHRISKRLQFYESQGAFFIKVVNTPKRNLDIYVHHQLILPRFKNKTLILYETISSARVNRTSLHQNMKRKNTLIHIRKKNKTKKIFAMIYQILSFLVVHVQVFFIRN